MKWSLTEGSSRGAYYEDNGWEDGSADALADHEKEQMDYAIACSLSEIDQNRNFIDDEQLLKDIQQASLAQLEEDKKLVAARLEEDELLAKALQESLNVESASSDANLFHPDPVSSSSESGHFFTENPELVDNFWPPISILLHGFGELTRSIIKNLLRLFTKKGICSGCCGEISDGRSLDRMDGAWHPGCFRCQECSLQITEEEFLVFGDRPYHKSCYHLTCYICKDDLPVSEAHHITSEACHITYTAHLFWMQKFCPSHECDGTPKCCSCQRWQPRDTTYLPLDDGRKLCPECLHSAIMDTPECQPLYQEIWEFYEGLNMKVSQQIPLLLVDRQALNEAKEGEQNGSHHMAETNGLTLFEPQTVRAITRSPRIGAGNPSFRLKTEPYKLVSTCDVTAVLILYGLPRLLTGSILAHELMHTWLWLSGYPRLRPEVEEGICQVMAHLWLDSRIRSSSAEDIPSPSSSSSSSSGMQQGRQSDFDRQLGKFYKHQIEEDPSPAYGKGFREANKAVEKYGLKQTLEHIKLTGSFPL